MQAAADLATIKFALCKVIHAIKIPGGSPTKMLMNITIPIGAVTSNLGRKPLIGTLRL